MPIDSTAKWVLLDPTLHLRDRFRGITFVAGPVVGFGQPGQMLMPVQFVDVLHIPLMGIAFRMIVAPESLLPSLPREGVAVPVDLRHQCRRTKI